MSYGSGVKPILIISGIFVWCRCAMPGPKAMSYKGYGPLWGITASAGPDGYRAFRPGKQDNGTLAPTAALSSMPYVPDESLSCLMEMYQN